MNLILTMAGQYQRFLREGYKIPKYLLPWGDRTILSVILHELNKGKLFNNIYLVANHRDEAFLPHIISVMRAQGLAPENLVMTHDTSGQAETAMIGINALNNIGDLERSPTLFHNIDTILLARNLYGIKNILDKNSGFIDVFNANNHGYSYVLVGEDRVVIDIAEKVIVSNLATSGLYGFHEIDTFKKFYRPEDIYISSIFKRMIEAGEKVIASQEHKESDTIVLGTPFEYMNASSTLLI